MSRSGRVVDNSDPTFIRMPSATAAGLLTRLGKGGGNPLRTQSSALISRVGCLQLSDLFLLCVRENGFRIVFVSVAIESVEGHLSVLADLDEVTVGITHVAAPFPAVRIG